MLSWLIVLVVAIPVLVVTVNLRTKRRRSERELADIRRRLSAKQTTKSTQQDRACADDTRGQPDR